MVHCLSRLTRSRYLCFFFFNNTATTEIYTLSLHDALPISGACTASGRSSARSTSRPSTPTGRPAFAPSRSEEHTSELQSHSELVCRLLLEKKKKKIILHFLLKKKKKKKNKIKTIK